MKTCGKCGSRIEKPGPCPVCDDKPFGRYVVERFIQIVLDGEQKSNVTIWPYPEEPDDGMDAK